MIEMLSKHIVESGLVIYVGYSVEYDIFVIWKLFWSSVCQLSIAQN